MLVGLVATAVLHARARRRFAHIQPRDDRRDTGLSINTGRWIFLAFACAFAIKVPLFPVHTWLPDAHTEAPTAGSVIWPASC
jgi:NADH-quinone oxidoreductase subunit M